ncbi:MAG: hypothetical protein E7299_09165 [Lachnospiraceae bacterium]|nr:hypothetical protein [Lachnospiraceae bacterium]
MKLKNPKGQYGYIKKQTRMELMKSIILFALSFSLYISGRITTGSNKNLLTIVAVLGFLPASQFAVRSIMFIRAKGCSEEIYQKVEKVSEGLASRFDLYLTSYKLNFQISHVVMKNKNLIGYTEDAKFDENACYEHLKTMFMKNGIKDITVKIFTDLDKYLERVENLKQSAMEEKTKLQDEVLQLMEDLSL